ncbi:MAG: diguanylate cyclase, partial [Nitrospirae bacterium]|nr:diguanylate cyclase [Nitrospirota bacterium]
IGVSTCPDNAHTAKDLILTADKALYKAKETGKNKVIVSSEE